MDRNDSTPLPPRPGEKAPVTQIRPELDAVPLYIQGMAIPLTEQEALGVIAQLSSALQTRRAGQGANLSEVMRNG